MRTSLAPYRTSRAASQLLKVPRRPRLLTSTRSAWPLMGTRPFCRTLFYRTRARARFLFLIPSPALCQALRLLLVMTPFFRTVPLLALCQAPRLLLVMTPFFRAAPPPAPRLAPCQPPGMTLFRAAPCPLSCPLRCLRILLPPALLLPRRPLLL
jgi:hypothetical protein